MAVCELSELDESQCGCRIHKPEADIPPRRVLYTGDPYSFTAKFDGTCAECKEPTLEGEKIVRIDIGYVHPYCTDEL